MILTLENIETFEKSALFVFQMMQSNQRVVRAIWVVITSDTKIVLKTCEIWKTIVWKLKISPRDENILEGFSYKMNTCTHSITL